MSMSQIALNVSEVMGRSLFLDGSIQDLSI